MKLAAAATAETATPRPTCSNGCGLSSRWTACTAITTAAMRMSEPSAPDDRYSALLWPKVCSLSGGRAATISAARVKIAARMLAPDSSASDRKPMEPVSR